MFSIFFVGDFKTDNGPGVANRMFRKGFKNNDDVIFSDETGKIKRIWELVVGIVRSKSICFCSFSKLNILGIRLCKILHKKTAYLMHGYLTYESKLNGILGKQLDQIHKLEQYMFQNIDKIICVSPKCRSFMQEREPLYAAKFEAVFNAVDVDRLKMIMVTDNLEREDNLVMSLGGGIGIKNNLKICQAIAYLNNKFGYHIKYLIVGMPYTEKDKICKYDFVEYYDRMDRKQVLMTMRRAKLYIQNSIFETFGLAPIEALYAGCDLLISGNMGVVDLFETEKEEYVIENVEDYIYIAARIREVLKKGNHERLIESLQTDKIKEEAVAWELSRKMV